MEQLCELITGLVYVYEHAPISKILINETNVHTTYVAQATLHYLKEQDPQNPATKKLYEHAVSLKRAFRKFCERIDHECPLPVFGVCTRILRTRVVT